MSDDCLKLTTYFGERDRANGELLADELFELYGRERVRASAMLRGLEGFGRHHTAHTDLLLTLSEDLPIVSVAVDTRERIEAMLPAVLAIKHRGLITLERARFATTTELPIDLRDEAKLTVYVGRRERAQGAAAFVAVCDTLRRHGVHGATVLLGVDGTRRGQRARARFFGRNADVPMMVIAVGPGETVAAVLAELRQTLRDPLLTLERVRVCRRDGEALGEPRSEAPTALEPGITEWWQKLTVHSSEDDRVDGHPLHRVLVRELREQRAAGATTLRGVWGFHDDLPPHGDRLLQARRHAPMMTIVVDTPQRMAELYPLIERITQDRGLVTLESVPVALPS
jgi:PII-like signaling protein